MMSLPGTRDVALIVDRIRKVNHIFSGNIFHRAGGDMMTHWKHIGIFTSDVKQRSNIPLSTTVNDKSVLDITVNVNDIRNIL